MARHRVRIALAVLITGACLVQLGWIRADRDFSPTPDSYVYLTRLFEFLDRAPGAGDAGFAAALEELSFRGRPPLYQLLTIPFLELFGRSEDAATAVNLPFLALLMLSTFAVGRAAGGDGAGLLAALLVAAYPPIARLTRAYLPYLPLAACSGLSLWCLALLVRERSVASAWRLSGSVVVGFLIHPNFAAMATLPTLCCAAWAALSGDAGGSLGARLRAPFVLRGLLPAGALGLVAVLAWYLPFGTSLLRTVQQMSSPELAAFRGFDAISMGFERVEPSFAWYLLTAPGALSGVLAGFLLVGVVHGIFARRPALRVATFSLVATGAILSAGPTRAWWYFSLMAAPAAVVTAAWLVALRPAWLAAVASGATAVVAVFVFAVSTWGAPPPLERAAGLLGAPLGSRTCRRPINFAFCPAPPQSQPARWPLRAVLATVFADPACRASACRFAAAKAGELSTVNFAYLRALEWPGAPLFIDDFRAPKLGHAYNLEALLRSDYLLYPLGATAVSSAYQAATVRFLQSPPAPFADAHRVVARFALPGEQSAALLRRTRPLDLREAEAAIGALDLPERYLTGREPLLASLAAGTDGPPGP